MKKTVIILNKGYHNSKKIILYNYLEYCFKNWPFRMGAFGFEDYFSQIGIDFFRTTKEDERLYILELMINLLYWAPRQEKNDYGNINRIIEISEVEKESNRILNNIDCILEQACNMRIREKYDAEYGCYIYTISKRDADVDSVLETIPELSEILLGYLDIRNKNDREYKRTVIEAIYRYLEPNRKKYSSWSCGSVSEEFFASVNAFGIRHNSKTQKKIHYKKIISVYDKLFKMGLYVIQCEKINIFKDELKSLRSN